MAAGPLERALQQGGRIRRDQRRKKGWTLGVSIQDRKVVKGWKTCTPQILPLLGGELTLVALQLPPAAPHSQAN